MRAQQLGASAVSLVPRGSARLSSMTRVWPADTSTGGISILVADLGNVGALAGPEGAESVQSTEMGNWRGERFGVRRQNRQMIDTDEAGEFKICNPH